MNIQRSLITSTLLGSPQNCILEYRFMYFIYSTICFHRCKSFGKFIKKIKLLKYSKILTLDIK